MTETGRRQPRLIPRNFEADRDGTTTSTNGPPPETTASDAVAEAVATSPKQSEALVRMCEQGYEVFHAVEEGNGRLLVIAGGGPNLAFGLRGDTSGLRQRLAAEYRHQNASTPSQNALSEALTVIEGQAAGRSATGRPPPRGGA